MSDIEPGLDLHDWQTQMEALQEQLEDSPEEALPDLADLVERMLVERDVVVETRDPVTESTRDPEVIERLRAAREVATRAEAGDADPGDVADAINNLRELFDEIVVGRGAP